MRSLHHGSAQMIDIDFDKMEGLVPVIAQDHETGEVLMLAFMNREAWKLTRETGIVHYWSRSRRTIWKKGETSGNVQEVKEIRVDCDNDALLIKVRQVGGGGVSYRLPKLLPSDCARR